MLVLPLLTTAFVFATDALARSTSRNPITALANVQNATIQTNNRRIHHLSHFDISFQYFNNYAKLSLEPNHDVIAEGATINVVGSDGVERSEPLDRSNHKVFKGTAWLWTGAEGWERVGSARVYVHRDGVTPLFAGTFAVNHISHHIELSSNYKTTRHELDPEIEDSSDEYMVLWRDSDIAAQPTRHGELKRDAQEKACRADNLLFNTAPEHPVYAKMLRRDESFWAASIDSIMGKRQVDGTPGGGGNSAGVNLVQTIGQTSGCPKSRQVALVGVAYDCNYLAAFNSNSSAVSDHIIAAMNDASGVYESTFNITLGIKQITPSAACSSSAGNPAWNVPCSQNINIEERLNLFSTWRGQQQDSNSHWTLLSTCATDSAVGLAWLGQACVNGSQSNGGNSAETVAGANVVYRTGGGGSEWQIIAHETGHTFGAVHDCTSSTCTDGTSVNAQQCCPLSSGVCDAGQRFIMNPATSDGISSFSGCSIGNICSAFGRRSVATSCFTNNRDVTLVTGQQCGNGIVEGDEQCDCGDADSCTSSCCDPTTCRFTSGSVCDDSNEPCCNQCQLASSSTVCRPSTGECDPEEMCSGTSAICPEDIQTPDGTSCANNLQCTSGQCTSRDMQCKTVMGSYTTGNDTYACDTSSCSISCASPEFGPGVCYGLKQNFLDGTDCGGGGRCNNGRCNGSSVGGQISGWVDRNKGIVIGVSAGVGGLLLLGILSCIVTCCRRRRRSRKIVASPPPPMTGFYGSRGGGGGSTAGVTGPPTGPVWNVRRPPMAHRGSSVRYA